MRLQADDLDDLDKWIVDYARWRGRGVDILSRPMAIRHLIGEAIREWNRLRPRREAKARLRASARAMLGADDDNED